MIRKLYGLLRRTPAAPPLPPRYARRVMRPDRWPDDLHDPYEFAEFACPYDNTTLVAPWQKCPKCGRND